MAKNENTKKRKLRTIIMDVCVKRATRSRELNKKKKVNKKKCSKLCTCEDLHLKRRKKITREKEEKKDNIDVCVKN